MISSRKRIHGYSGRPLLNASQRDGLVNLYRLAHGRDRSRPTPATVRKFLLELERDLSSLADRLDDLRAHATMDLGSVVREAAAHLRVYPASADPIAIELRERAASVSIALRLIPTSGRPAKSAPKLAAASMWQLLGEITRHIDGAGVKLLVSIAREAGDAQLTAAAAKKALTQTRPKERALLVAKRNPSRKR